MTGDDRLRLRCRTCGPVRAEVGAVVVHHNRHDGFRLLQADCPVCGDVVVTADPVLLDRAVAAGARVRQLLPPAPPLTDADLEELHHLLDDEAWCAWLASGEPPDGPVPA